MPQLLVNCPFLGHSKFIDNEQLNNVQNIEQINYLFAEIFKFPVKLTQQTYITSQSKILNTIESFTNANEVTINLRLPGGKGGFGSLMRNQANKAKKQNNSDHSRDINGRRIRNQIVEKQLIEFYKKKKEEDKKISKSLEEFKIQQDTIKQGQQVMLKQEFKDKLDNIDNNMASNIISGLKKQQKFIPKDNKKEEDQQEQANQQQNEEEEEKVNGNQVQNEEQEENLNQKRKRSSEQEKESVQNEPTIEKKKEIEQKKEANQQKWEDINLNTINQKEDLEKLDDEHIKHELNRLGIKVGGRKEDRIQRLWEIKLNPANLFNPKYLAKKK